MSHLDLFETERLVLSGWRRDQLPDLVRLHGDPVVRRGNRRDAEPREFADRSRQDVDCALCQLTTPCMWDPR